MTKNYEANLNQFLGELYTLDVDTEEGQKLLEDLEAFMGDLQGLRCRAKHLIDKIKELDNSGLGYEGSIVDAAEESQLMVTYVDSFGDCVEALHEVFMLP